MGFQEYKLIVDSGLCKHSLVPFNVIDMHVSDTSMCPTFR